MMNEKKYFHKLNNKGASLVTVVLTIAFVAILVSVVMMTSLVNFKMKRMNAYAKDSFYSAEQVLDEINIGLQRYISDSLSVAYTEIMENYSEYSVDRKNMLLQTMYYENMWDKLEVAGSNHAKYSTQTLYAFLKDSTKWSTADPDDGYGAVVRAIDGSGNLVEEGTMVTYDTGIILKDLRVYYKDSKGTVSIIETDVRLTYPKFDFANTTGLPSVSSYGFVADGGVVVEGSTALTLEGSFYADSFVNEEFDLTSTKSINHKGDGKVIVKHDMNLEKAAFSNESEGVLWADGIQTISGNLYLNGETLVADDLNINGNGSIVELAGVYNGFGNSGNDAQKSSAILINGSNSTVDLSGLDRLTVAGHSFVGTKREAAVDLVPVEDLEEDENIDVDVYSGESIALKSNQTMYLVPPECIGVTTENGKSLYNKNPLTSDEYEDLQGFLDEAPTRYAEVSTTVNVGRLGGIPIAEFVKVGTPLQPEDNSQEETQPSDPGELVNLALNKRVTTSSQESGEHAGVYAVDGDYETRWASIEGRNQQDLVVDLGSTQVVSQIRILWEAAYARSYEIQVSNNNTTWETVYSNNRFRGSQDPVTINFTPKNARYVRVYCIERGTDWGFSIYELEVYGELREGGLDEESGETTPGITVGRAEKDAFIKVFVQTGEDYLVYYYMNFISEAKANEYFSLYYNTNKEVYDRYAESYLKVLKFPASDDTNTVRIAAGGIQGSSSGEYELIEGVLDNAGSKLSVNQGQNQQRFDSLCTNLTEDLTNVDNESDTDLANPIVFEQLVDEENLSAFLSAAGVTTPTGSIRVGDEHKAYLANDGYTFETGHPDNTDVKLVITTGDVIINSDFEGMILANGKVTIGKGEYTITANEGIVNSLLSYPILHEGNNILVATVLYGYDDYKFEATTESGNSNVVKTMADLIIYENWKKE